jgi:hypothetical protein
MKTEELSAEVVFQRLEELRELLRLVDHLRGSQKVMEPPQTADEAGTSEPR